MRMRSVRGGVCINWNSVVGGFLCRPFCHYDILLLRHHIGDEGKAMATIGQLSKFQPETEKASA